MIDLEEFVKGWGAMGLLLRHPFSAAEARAFHLALANETNAEEWHRFCATQPKVKGWRFMPGVADLVDALREFRGGQPLDVEAVAAYERVLEAGTYTPEGGTTWEFRKIRETCGFAAAEAFVAAGGHSAFASSYHEGQRREKFVAAYRDAVREDESTRLLPAPEPAGLLVASESERLTDAQALERVRELAGETKAVEKPKPTVVELTDERLEVLRRQAEQIQGS